MRTIEKQDAAPRGRGERLGSERWSNVPARATSVPALTGRGAKPRASASPGAMSLPSQSMFLWGTRSAAPTAKKWFDCL